MRKVVAGFACSLDGYIEGPNGEYDWILIDSEIDFAEQAKRFDTYFYGRRSYQAVLAMKAPITPNTKHYVFSTTLHEVAPGYTLIKGEIKEAVLNVKNMEGKDIAVFGGANLLGSLFNEGLVDEISVSVIPVILGKGKPMVDLLEDQVNLRLEHCKTYSNGTVQLIYTVLKSIVDL